MSQRTAASALLDAARECALSVGVRRTTLSDVARRAGTSRMTVYRTFPDAARLWSALLTRELGAAAAEVEAEVSGLPTARQRLVEATMLGLSRMEQNPLVHRILEVDPELLLPYLTERLGESQRMLMQLFERHIAAGIADGSIRHGDPGAMAFTLQLLATGLLLSTRLAEREGRTEAVHDELRHLLDRHLRP